MNKEYLKLYGAVRTEIENIKGEIVRLQYLLINPSASVLSITGKNKTNLTTDPHTSLVIKISRLEDHYFSRLEELCSLQIEIELAIEKLLPVERALLRYRYIDCLEFNKIAAWIPTCT